jgi:hypothetical protein
MIAGLEIRLVRQDELEPGGRDARQGVLGEPGALISVIRETPRSG